MTKPLYKETTVAVVFPWETAFDHEAKTEAGDETLCEAYAKQAANDPGAWRGLLKTIDGKRPVEFVIGPLGASEVARLEDECFTLTDEGMRKLTKPSELYLRVFKASLRDIVNGRVDPPKVKRGGLDRVDPEWVERTFAGGTQRHAAQFVGMIAWAWNAFTETDAKNS